MHLLSSGIQQPSVENSGKVWSTRTSGWITGRKWPGNPPLISECFKIFKNHSRLNRGVSESLSRASSSASVLEHLISSWEGTLALASDCTILASDCAICPQRHTELDFPTDFRAGGLLRSLGALVVFASPLSPERVQTSAPLLALPYSPVNSCGLGEYQLILLWVSPGF